MDDTEVMQEAATEYLENLQETPKDEELKQLADYCVKLKEKQKEVTEAEKKLKSLQKQEAFLSSEVIPDFLQSKGLKSIKLLDGSDIKIKEAAKCSLPKKSVVARKKVLKWIIQKGGTDIIKKVVIVEDPTQGLLNYLKESEIDFKNIYDVHPATLTAWLNRKLGISKNSLQMVTLDEAPKELNVFIHKTTEIK